jgi:hypothetical protein
MIRSTRFASLAATLALLGAMSGCGTGAPGATQLTLRHVAAGKSAAKATSKAASTAATKAAAPAVAVPAAEAARQAKVAAAGAGDVRVAFASMNAGRKLMAIDDVAGVRVTLTAANGARQVQTLDRATLDGEAPAAAFAGVPVGAASLAVEVLDGAGALLGQSAASTQVLARQTVEVGLTVHIAGASATTGNVAATVAIVEDDVVPADLPTPTPGPVTTPTPVATATPWVPGFLQSPTPSPAPSAAIGGTRDVWGRLYDYSANQQMTGTIRFTSTDAAVPFDVTADLRADGYYYVPAVPTGVTVEVAATSGSLGVTAWYVFEDDGQTTYDWLDLFLEATSTSDSNGWWW